MPSLTTLPPELWLAISNYLTLDDLLTAYETFDGDIGDTDVHTISRTLAVKRLDDILAKCAATVQVFVKSNGNGLPPPFFQRQRFRSYSHSAVKVDRSLGSFFNSRSKLTFSATHIENTVTPYRPELHGEEPVEISQVNLSFYPDSSSQENDHYLRLFFVNPNAQSPCHIDLENHRSASLERTLRQDLRLHAARWISREPFKIRELPKSFFGSPLVGLLGDSASASTTFTKTPADNTPSPALGIFTAPPSRLNSISLSFEDFESRHIDNTSTTLLTREIVPPVSTNQI
jgi:hypothetical protein